MPLKAPWRPCLTGIVLAVLALPANGAIPPASGELTCGGAAVESQANLNEIRFSGQTAEFVEAKILQNDVSTAGWNLCFVAANIDPPRCVPFGAGDFALDPDRTTSDDGETGPFSAASYLFHDFANPVPNATYGELVLLDANEEVIDFVRYCRDLDANQCDTYWTTDEGCGLVVEHGSTNIKGLARSDPDGTGDWGESADPSPGTSNEPPFLDHYTIDHDGSGVTCLGEQVTIEAIGSDGNDYSVEVDTVLTLSTDAATPLGAWSRVVTGSGTLSDPDPADGTATYTWPGGESLVTLVFDYPVLVDGDSDTFTFDVIDDSGIPATETTGLALASDDPAITFANAGFVFLDAPGGTATLPGQIAGKSSNLAPGAADPVLWAVRTDTDTTACTALFPDGGDVTVELGSTCEDPGTCLAGTRVAVTNNGTTTAVANPQNTDGGSDYTDVLLRFGADSQAALEFAYPDAGAIRLHARYPIPFDDGTLSGEYVAGSSNAFVVRPFGFDVDFNLDTDDDGLFDDVLDDRANNGTGGASYAADADGSRFVMAGETFQAVVTAVTWAGDDDADNDGLPDPGADLTDNPATPNFGQEASAASVALQQILAAAMPADAILGSLSGATVTGFSAGRALASLSWNEVGILDLQARFDDADGDGTDDYLGTPVDLVNAPPQADPVAGGAPGVGRFYPARFVLKANVPAFLDACTAGAAPFTYLGQGASDSSEAFGFATAPLLSVLPQRAGETDAAAFTWNYRGSFWKLHASPANPVTLHRGYQDRVDPADPTFFLAYVDAADAATLTLDADPADGRTPPLLEPTGDRFAYARRSDPEDPFAANVDLVFPAFEDGDPALARNLIDADGVCFDAGAYDAASDVIVDAGATCNYDDAPGNEAGLTISGIGGTELRYGEPFTRGTYGTTAQIGDQLTADLEARYYDSGEGGFVTHTDDACTTVEFCKTDTGVTTTLARTDATPLNPDAGGVYGPLALGYDATRPGEADVVATLTADASATGGRTTLTFAGCGGGWPAWLPDAQPATLVFGIYRGDDRILHLKE
ncbi:MAG: DUF6701 domain-containing protein [Gammaproteobacteria bacterium]|nr:DUF6701 domain-containing protein [Gammaproteobacteria bacterium]